MRHRSRLIVALGLISTCGVGSSRAGLNIPLDVTEPAHLARTAWPATAGVPIARGIVHQPGSLSVVGPDGKPAPSQMQVLERWPDGSIRWLLVDFLATVASGGKARYEIVTGRTPPPTAPHVSTHTDDDGRRHVLDSGVIQAAFAPASGTLLDGIALTKGIRLDPIPWPELVTESPPSRGGPAPTFTVETSGPVRTEVLLRRRDPGGFEQAIRVAVFAGQPFVRVQQTLTNLSDPDQTPVRDLRVDIPGTFGAAELGFAQGQRRFPTLVKAHVLAYPDDVGGRVDGGESVGSDGWLRATTGTVALTLLSRYPAEEYPQALEVGPHELRLGLLAARDGAVSFGSGAAKTFEWWLVVEPKAKPSDPARLAAMLRHPLVAVIPADQIVGSGALVNALSPKAPGAADFLARLTQAAREYVAAARTSRWDDGPPVPCSERHTEHPRRGFTGALNWGDWNFPGYRDTAEHGCDPWGNLEYDLPAILALGFSATGDRLFLDTLTPAIRHYRDVDIIHHWAGHPERVGLNHPHKPMHFAFSSVHAVDLGHTWLEGLLAHWRLTGEVRSLEAARGIADVLVPMVDKAGNPRQLGWPMIALSAAADATGEARYLAGARAYADRALRGVKPNPATGDWKMGILADGMRAVAEATGAPEYRAWLDAYATALVAHAERFEDPRYALPLGYLAAVGQNRSYAVLARSTVQRMDIASWGKPLALAGRVGFRVLAPLARFPDEKPRR